MFRDLGKWAKLDDQIKALQKNQELAAKATAILRMRRLLEKPGALAP